MATKTWYGTIYSWRSRNIKVDLKLDYTVPETMLDDVDFKMDTTRGIVLYDPDNLVEKSIRKGTVAVLDHLTILQLSTLPKISVLYTCEVLLKRPVYEGIRNDKEILLKSGSLLQRLPDEKLQCKYFQTFMAAALR